MARPDYCPVGGEPCQSMCDEPCSWSGSKRRREDEALIRQMLEALDTCDPGLYMGPHDSDKPSYDARKVGAAIYSARARLGTNPPPRPDVPKPEA